MGIFGARAPIGEEEFEWQLAGFKWMLEEFEGIERHREAPLITPTTDFFPDSLLTGHARAEELFGQVQSHAGLDHIAFRLEAGDSNRPTKVASGLGLVHDGDQAPLGTYRVVNEDGTYLPIITYNPSMLSNPFGMVATFAHELAHRVMDSALREPPGGADMHELMTDLTAVFLGFGIFLANGAKSFHAYQTFDEMGWSSSRSGYLSEAALVTALAIAERLANRDPMAGARWLKSHLAADLKKVDRYLVKRHPALEADVMRVDLSEYGVER